MPTPQAKFEITADDKTAAAFRSALSQGKKFSTEMGNLLKLSFAGIGVAGLASGIASAVELGDEMGKLAEKTGLTASAASELSRVFQQNDLDNGALTSSFRKMQVELSKSNDIFGKLGLSVSQLKGQAADRTFEDIAQRISEIKDPADRARAAVEIFGKSGADLLPMMMQGAEGIRAVRSELGGLSDKDVAQLQAADDAIKKLEFLKQDFWGRAAIGVSLLAEKIGLIDLSAADQLIKDMDDLVKRRDIAQSEYDSESSAGAFSKWWYGEEGERSMALAKKRLDDLNAQLRAKNALYQDLTKPKESTATDLPLVLNATSSGLSEVTISAAKLTTEYERLLESQIEVHKAFTNYYQDLRQQGDDSAEFWRKQSEGVGTLADSLADSANSGIQAMKAASEEIKPWAEEINRSMFSAFSDAFYNLGSGANSFADDMIDAFRRVLANQATLQLFEMLSGAGKSLSANNDKGSFWGTVGSGLVSMFGGARASGGPVSSGRAYLVGEQGPELFMPGMSGNIVPNHALAGAGTNITYAPVYHVSGSNMTPAQMLAWSKATTEQAVAKMQQMRNEGRF